MTDDTVLDGLAQIRALLATGRQPALALQLRF